MLIKSNVIQSSILPSNLFKIRADVIINTLIQSDCGCFGGRIYWGCIVFAVDIILFSISVTALWKMLGICLINGEELVLMFKNNISFFLIWPIYCDLINNLNIDILDISCTESIKCFGVDFSRGKMCFLSFQKGCVNITLR